MGRRPDRFKATYSGSAHLLDAVGAKYYASSFGQVSGLFIKCLRHLFDGLRDSHFPSQQVISQIYFTGFEAVKLICIVSSLFGAVVVLEALIMMPKVGFGDSFGNITVVIIVRELGPILTAFLVAGRTGSGLATYIGNMQVESEIDALKSMGVDPIKFLALPALLGGIVSMIGLSIIFGFVAITAGYICGMIGIKVLHLNIALDLQIYLNSIFNAMTVTDLFMIVIKPAFFGIFISMIACYKGLSLGNDSRLVPKAASETVVACFICIVLSDLVFLLFYLPEYMKQINSLGI